MIKATFTKLFGLYAAITALFLPCSINCGGGKAVIYKWHDTFSFQSETMLISPEKIDKFETRILYFTITSKEDCIVLGIAGYIHAETILGGTKSVPVCYIIERNVGSLSHTEFAELARNFNTDWESRQNLQICSNEDLPFLRLESGLYRIKTTTFMKDPYNLKISVQSQNPVLFSSTLPEKQGAFR